jgi:hypothetical protein
LTEISIAVALGLINTPAASKAAKITASFFFIGVTIVSHDERSAAGLKFFNMPYNSESSNQALQPTAPLRHAFDVDLG